MSATECKNCQANVADGIERCPYCDTRNPTNYASAMIVIHRKPAYAGRMQKATIVVNGTTVSKLSNDEAIAFDLPFGQHVLEVKFAGQFTKPRLELNLTSPKTQIYDIVMGFWGFSFKAR